MSAEKLNKKSEETGSTPMPEITPEEVDLFNLFKELMNQAGAGRVSSKEWAQINKSEHVKTIEPKLTAKTKATKYQEDLNLLLASKTNGITLHGKINGVKSANPNKNTATSLAEISFNNESFRVFVPSYELYLYDLKKYKDPGEEQKVQNHMLNMLNAEIDFVVVSEPDRKNKTVYASRLAAMAKTAKANFKDHVSKTEKPRVNVGDVVEARVVCVRHHSIVVDIFGSDCNIPATKTDNRVSWEYVNDCETMFSMNDIITVKILDIKPIKVTRGEKTYTLYDVKASYKDTQENPLDIYWDSVEEGELGSAVITGISGGSVFCKYKNRFTILCAYPERRKTDPYVGQQRKVQITTKRIDPDGTKRVFGIFKDI